MNMEKKYIYIKFAKEGIHCYPEAGTNPDLADVSFLQYPHRHMFHFMIAIEVNELNRDIEFIQLKRYCEGLYDQKTLDLNSKSCEMIASELADVLQEKYPGRDITVDVSEDDENGSMIVRIANANR